MGKLARVLVGVTVILLLGIIFSGIACAAGAVSIPPGAKVLEAEAFGREPMIDGTPASKVTTRWPSKVPQGFGPSMMRIKKESIPPSPRRQRESLGVQSFSLGSMGLWRVYAVKWSLTGMVEGAKWITLSDPMYVHVSDGVISVARLYPAPKLTGTYFYSYFWDNGRGATLSIEYKYVVISSSSAELWVSINREPFWPYWSGSPVDYLILEPGLLLAAGSIGIDSDEFLEQYIIGTWTVTENSPAFSGVIGKFDLRLLALKNLKATPPCFNPEGKDPEDPETPRYFTRITGDIVALPVSTTLFPGGWTPSGGVDPLRWIVRIYSPDATLVKTYQGSSPVVTSDSSGKVGEIQDPSTKDGKLRWEGEQDISQEKAPAGPYYLRGAALGSVFFPGFWSTTVTRDNWKRVIVAFHVPYFNIKTGGYIDPVLGPIKWGNLPYGDPTHRKIIGEKGCFMASIAMVLKYYKIHESPEGKPTNPYTVDEWLKRHGGYDLDDGVYADVALRSYSRGEVFRERLVLTRDTSKLDAVLGEGAPPILENRDRFVTIAVGGEHYVVATGKCEDEKTWTINDDAFGEKLTLKAYSNQFESMTIAKKGASPFQGQLEIHLSCASELLLTDALGSRTGYDPVTKTVVQEIPDSSYIQHEEIRNVDGRLIEPARKELNVGFRAPGVYTLQVVGVAEEEANLGISILDESLNRTLVQKHLTLTSTTVLRYKINFKGDGIPPEVREVKVDIASIRQAVQGAYKAGKIDNQGIMTSLVQKLDAAQAALDRKQLDVVRNILGAFIHEVEAQKGKHITKEVAEALIGDTKEFLSELR